MFYASSAFQPHINRLVESSKHSPLSPSKKATDDSPPPVSDPATSLQRSTVPDEENQLPSHPSPTISVLQEPEEQKAPTVELKPAIGNGGNKVRILLAPLSEFSLSLNR